MNSKKVAASLIIREGEQANPPMLIDPNSELGKKIPASVSTVNLTLTYGKKTKVRVDFDGNKIKNPKLKKAIIDAVSILF